MFRAVAAALNSFPSKRNRVDMSFTASVMMADRHWSSGRRLAVPPYLPQTWLNPVAKGSSSPAAGAVVKREQPGRPLFPAKHTGCLCFSDIIREQATITRKGNIIVLQIVSHLYYKASAFSDGKFNRQTKLLCYGLNTMQAKLRATIILGNSGFSFIFAIIALIVLGALGAATSLMSGSATHSKLEHEEGQQAYYASLSGLNYVKAVMIQANAGKLPANWNMNKLANTYTISSDKQFVLMVENTGGNNYSITSEGICNSGNAFEARCINKTNVTYTPLPNLGDYNFLNPSNRPDYAKLSTDQTRDFPSGLDDADVTPPNITVGKDYTYGFGNIWFTGSVENKSSLGVSDFGTGLRLFLTFEFTTNIGDGFVVCVLNANNNNYQSCGGDSAEGGLLGYAGDSRVYNSTDGGFASTVKEYVDQSGLGKGLKAPKFGVAIDTYNNSGGTWYPTDTTVGCYGDNGLMNDPSSNQGGTSSSAHHVAYVFWGDDLPYPRKTCTGPSAAFEGNTKRYSDVRHGNGDNSNTSDTNAFKYSPFYTKTTYYFRMDVARSSGSYTLKTWIATCNDSENNCKKQVFGTSNSQSNPHTGSLSDTKNDFSGSNSFLNRLSRTYISKTINMSPANDTLFNKFMWGITSGSGVATQQIDLRNISISLRP